MAKYSLEVDTGLVEIDIKDNKSGEILGTFEFSPSDSNIVSRYKEVVAAFNSITPPEEKEGEDNSGAMTDFQISFCETVKEQLDYLLGNKVSEKIFCRLGPLSVLENGDFFYEHVLEGIGNIISAVVEDRIKTKMQKIEDATSKYNHE